MTGGGALELVGGLIVVRVLGLRGLVRVGGGGVEPEVVGLREG